MASRLIVLAAVLAACQATPIWFADDGFLPGTVFIREGRSSDFAPPSIAYGFGSGFSSNIAGITHSTGIGASFQSGDAQAYGSGIAGSNGNVFARGIGFANANPQSIYRTNYPFAYSPYNGLRHGYENNYGAAATPSQNFGFAQAQNSGRYQTAVSASENLGGYRGYGSSTSSASSTGYGSAATSTSDGAGTAISSAQTRDGLGYNAAISASQKIGNIRANTAHAVQQHGGELQQSGASSYNAPGIQATQSHSITTGSLY